MNPFSKTFDELLNGLLTDYQNQFPGVDISKGSLVFIKSACLASALWGAHQNINWTAQQIFPDTADSENLEHHAWLRGLTKEAGESDSELLQRLLDYIRKPPAGGNQYDYERWALEVPGVAKAWSKPLGQGPGTVDVLILADAELTGSDIPSDELCATVRSHLVDICPNDVQYLRVLPPEILLQDVTITLTDASVSAELAAANITNYLSTFKPGQVLYRSQLLSLALGGGTGDADVTLPVANVVPSAYQMIRPGVIDVA